MKIKKSRLFIGVIIFLLNREIVWTFYLWLQKQLERAIEFGESDLKQLSIIVLMAIGGLVLDIISVFILKKIVLDKK